MAHDLDTKARALAQLMLGDSPRHVAELTGVPRRTIRRWQGEVPSLWSQIPGINELRAQIRAQFPGLAVQVAVC